MSQTLDINVVSSLEGGEISYNREITIGRIQQATESTLRDRISPGQISTLKVRVKKPAGAIRRASRGQEVTITNFQFKITPGGSIADMGLVELIDVCCAAVSKIVLAQVPADHLCSLVIAFKEGTGPERLPS